MGDWYVRLLGDFVVEHRGIPLAFPIVKTRALLAYLLSHPHVPLRREKLATLLFPNYPDSQARKNLNLTLTRLRQALAPGQAGIAQPFLTATYDTIQLKWDPVEHQVDVWTFHHLWGQCQAHPHDRLERCGQCLARLKQVVQLYEGEFLAGLSLEDCPEFQEWRLWQVEAYEQKVRQALALLTDQALATADFAAAQQYACHQIELTLWEEPAHRQLMQALGGQGQRTAALAQYETLWQILATEMQVEPEAETVALYETIKNDRVTRIHPSPLHPVTLSRLPKAGTPFFGRQGLLSELSTLLLDPMNRLVTLVGAGGVGKTRLAVALGERLEAQFADGVWFVPLNDVKTAEPSHLAQAIGLAIGYTFSPGQDVVPSLLAYLHPRHLLLILDNFEHLVDGADFVLTLLDGASSLSLLVTSRQRLGFQREIVRPLGGLPVPRTLTDTAVSSVQLFVERGERTGVRLETAVLPDVARICRFLAGIPLALELAAAWVDRLAVATIYDVIVSNLNMLHSQMGDVPLRHRSMRAVFEVSWGILGEAERNVLARLSVFRSGFTAKAAVSIATATPVSLETLAQASLIRQEENGRYTIHELLRQFAEEKLAHPEAESATQQAHSHYFLTWLADQEVGLSGSEPQRVTAVLRQDLGNIQQAWEWAVTFQMAAEIKTAVYGLIAYLEIEGLLPEGQRMLEQAIQALHRAPEAHYVLPRLLVGQGQLLSRMGRLAEAEQHIQEAMPLALSYKEALDIGNGYLTWASLALQRGDYLRTVHYAHEAVLLAESESLPHVQVASLTMQAHAQVRLGAKEEVVAPLYRQALTTFQELGDRRQMGWVLNQLGGLALNWGKYNQARRYWQQALAIFVAVGEQAAASVLSNNVGDIYIRLGCFEKAKTYYQQSRQMAVATGTMTGGRVALSGLGCAEFMLGNLVAAEEYGRQALQGLREANLPVQEVYTLVEFGPVLLAQEKWSEAVELYHRVLHLSKTLGEPYVMVDGMAGLAQAAFCQGQRAEALEWVNHILAQNDWYTLGGAYDPFIIYLICYRILTAHEDARAGEILAVANGRLQELLADLEEEELRQCFLTHPIYRALLAA